MNGTASLRAFAARRSLAALLLCGVCAMGPVAGHASAVGTGNASSATAATQPVGRITGLPLPRYVSIKAATARMRVGPSTDYPIRWIYEAKGLPIEIIEEYGEWRQVRDSDGTNGWMNAVLLSGKRTGLVTPWDKAKGPLVSLRNGPGPTNSIVAELQPGVRLNISHCDSHWCKVSVQNQSLAGYVRQGLVWGVYPSEIVKD
jgi:SH3-like domain-containing protein